MLADDCGRTRACRLHGKLRAVGLGAGNGDEHEAFLNLAAVGGHAGHVDAGKAGIDLGFRQ